MLVTPISPHRTGNGLAMRAGVLLEALAVAGPVDLLVIPVSGPGAVTDWAASIARTSRVVALPEDAATARSHTSAQLADPVLRARLSDTQPLPVRARQVPPTLCSAVAEDLGDASNSTVVVMREYLVPFGVWLARELRAARCVVDLDDDAESVLRAMGDPVEADGYGRLARAWLRDADAVCAASAAEARAMATRYGLPIHTVPNAIRAPASTAPRPDRDALLFVGNLTYRPNIDAAALLATEVLPLVRRRRSDATVTLVGAHGTEVAALAAIDGVEVTGPVPDVAPHHAAADVVVVPLLDGSGTRIKVLEAMAHGRPVVATARAVSGLDLTDGGDVVLAEGAAALADATCDLLHDRVRWAQMADAGLATVTRSHTTAAVGPLVRRVCLGVDDPPRSTSDATSPQD